MDWITGIQNAVNYIEDHITEELDYEEIGVIHWYWEEGNDELNHSRYCELWLPITKKD